MAGKFRRYHGLGKRLYVRHPSIMLKNFRDLFYFIIGFVQSVWLLIWWRPNVLFVKGGFVGLPVGLAAALLRIPIVTHDSDTVPGLTNRILSRYARFSAVAMPAEYYSYPKNKIRYTGLPIGPEYQPVTPQERATTRKQLGIPESAFVVAIFGGSLGAVRVNDAIMHIVAQYLAADDSRWVLHQTGSHQYQAVEDFYMGLEPKLQNRVRAWAYVDAMHEVTAVADIVVSRAGSTIHQLSAQQKPVILIPNPVLTGVHQTVNAKVLAERGAAIVITEQELKQTDDTVLLTTLDTLTQNPEKRLSIATAISSLAVPNAAKNIVSALDEAAA